MSFHALHRPGDPFVLPNAWDVASALAFVTDGCAAVGTTSLGIAAAHGLPDGSRAVRELTFDLVGRLATLPVPVSVDLEDGFHDDPEAVADDVVALGVAGVNLEDSTAGRLVDPERHAAKVAAVVARCPGVFVNARVDTFWLGEEADVATTLARARRYVAAGAHGVFVPGSLTATQIRELTSALPVPLNVLASPAHTTAGLAGLGVARISTGSLPYRAALDAARDVVGRVRSGDRAPAATTYAEVQRLVADHA